MGIKIKNTTLPGVKLINRKLTDLGLDQPYHWEFGLDAYLKEMNVSIF